MVVEIDDDERRGEEHEILLDLQNAQRQLDTGQGVHHEEARERVLSRLEP